MTTYRIGQTIRNTITGKTANVTGICNEYLVVVSYDRGDFRIYYDRMGAWD